MNVGTSVVVFPARSCQEIAVVGHNQQEIYIVDNCLPLVGLFDNDDMVVDMCHFFTFTKKNCLCG